MLHTRSLRRRKSVSQESRLAGIRKSHLRFLIHSAIFRNIPPMRLVRRQQGVSQERNLAEIQHFEITVCQVCFLLIASNAPDCLLFNWSISMFIWYCFAYVSCLLPFCLLRIQYHLLSLSHRSCLSGWCFMVFISADCWCSCWVCLSDVCLHLLLRLCIECYVYPYMY